MECECECDCKVVKLISVTCEKGVHFDCAAREASQPKRLEPAADCSRAAQFARRKKMAATPH